MRAGILTRRRVQLDAIRDACDREEPVIVIDRVPGKSPALCGRLQSLSISGLDVAIDDELCGSGGGNGVVDVYFRDADGIEYVAVAERRESDSECENVARALHLGVPLRLERPRRRQPGRKPGNRRLPVRVRAISFGTFELNALLCEMTSQGMTLEMSSPQAGHLKPGECYRIEVPGKSAGPSPGVFCRCLRLSLSGASRVRTAFEYCAHDDPTEGRRAIESFEHALTHHSANAIGDSEVTQQEDAPCS